MWVNIKESIWSDYRFLALHKELGDSALAIGSVVMAWRLAQKYWIPNKQKIPKDVFLAANLPKALITCGLATNGDGGVYLNGTEESCSWWFKCQVSGKTGGLASAKKRKEAKGLSTLGLGYPNHMGRVPQPNIIQYNIKEDLNTCVLPALKRKQSSLNPKKEENQEKQMAAIDAVYREYPKRPGTNKKAGVGSLTLQLKTEQDFSECLLAAKNYRIHCEREKLEQRFIQHFATWCGSVANPKWREWVELSQGSQVKIIKWGDDD